MIIKLPYQNKDEKADVKVLFVTERHKTEEENNAMDIIAGIVMDSTLSYVGKFDKTYISIKKEKDSLLIELPDIEKLESLLLDYTNESKQ